MLRSFKYCIILILPIFGNAERDYGQLPNCKDESVPGLVLVSTIDGRLSALNSDGALEWQIETEPGPLLVSNIHSLELTNSGKWIRIIPSLTGSLYRFDGSTIDPISITADSLLRSSFKYSDDLVIAGGLEVRTYGVGFRTGKIHYTCSSLNCVNNTNSEGERDDILLVERSTQTVRAIESRSGYERWNFSVGTHNIKLPQISCSNPTTNLFNWNISAIIPDGLLLASNHQDNVRTTWQYHFSSPIVRVWKWNGYKLNEIDLFQVRNDKEVLASPAIYLGMHKKQLYIHESFALQNTRHDGKPVAESGSVAKIPWKPIPASGALTEDDSTAISVLYSSEYVNGHGYYLFPDREVKQRNSGLCENNGTLRFPALTQRIVTGTFGQFIWSWWKEIFVSVITTSVLFKVMFRQFTRRQNQNKVIFVERHVEVPAVSEETPDFNSRYLNDFNTLQCLGKGGFGVVFEVKQKIDECHYAIKRIILPTEESKREGVMREVKALAKLEHHNIVRYFNSWVEKPPFGWQEHHDSDWIKGNSEFAGDYTTTTFSHKKTSMVTGSAGVYDESQADSFIVFDDSKEHPDLLNTDDYNSNKQDATLLEDTQSVGVNWRRPSRRYHSINPKNPPAFLYIQMQLCQKHSLKEWLVENKDRNYEAILHIFKQILSAVEYVHLRGLIHRDLKPSNIFFSLDGQIKVGDFGLVKDEEESHDSIHSLSPHRGHTREVGTRLYMSPEQLNGCKYNYKVDIYSLGLILFELLVYFGTDMERIRTMTNLRDNKFPQKFIEQYPEEHKLLTLMLCKSPEKRLTTYGVRARPPLSSCDTDYNKTYDFELPKTPK